MSDRMEEIVATLATSAGREIGSAGHAAARGYLIEQMESRLLVGYGKSGFQLPYSHGGTNFCNLLGVLPGSNTTLPPILLAAHYDTCGPYPGADDNAAAIAILLTLVEQLRSVQLERSVIFAFFDAEEPPHYLSDAMGSTWFYRHQRSAEIHSALVLDLVGHDVPIPSLEDVLFVTGMESDPGLEAVFRDSAAAVSGICAIPVLSRYIGDMSDYYAFRVAQRPYLFFSCGQWPHYHTAGDTPEKLNYVKMASIRDFLFEAVQAVSRSMLSGPFEGYDTTTTEIEYFKSAAGPLLQQLGVELSSRAVTATRSRTLFAGGYGFAR